MTITWEVEDGYAGKSRPQRTIIDDEDIEECETQEEFEGLVNGAIQEDFEKKITYYFEMTNFPKK